MLAIDWAISQWKFLDADATDWVSVMSVFGPAAWRSVNLGSEPRPEKG